MGDFLFTDIFITMNLQEQIRRIIREEDFIPLESLNIVIKDYEDWFDVLIMNEDKQIGEISFAKESLPNVYTIVDATIDDEYKGNRIYPKTIINLFKERPNIIINSVFRSPEAEKSWRHLLSNLPSNIGKSVKHYKEEDTTLYQLKLKNIQESIRRILREDSLKNDLMESEEKKPKYLNIIEDLVEPFKDEDCVCDIRVLYGEKDDMYLIDLNLGTEELNDKFIAVIGMNHYVSKLRRDIKETIKDYLPIDNFYVGSYASQKCNSKSLNESSIKEKSLVKLIEKDGLYNFIEMSGLDFNQVRSLLKNIDNSKEILKQYIREFVLEHDGTSGENHGSLFALRLPLSNTKYVNDILVQDSEQIAVEIIEYHIDEYGHREDNDQYLTSINNLTDEELLSILSWMMETVEGGYWF